MDNLLGQIRQYWCGSFVILARNKKGDYLCYDFKLKTCIDLSFFYIDNYSEKVNSMCPRKAKELYG